VIKKKVVHLHVRNGKKQHLKKNGVSKTIRI
jgi:hypothetical protein